MADASLVCEQASMRAQCIMSSQLWAGYDGLGGYKRTVPSSGSLKYIDLNQTLANVWH